MKARFTKPSKDRLRTLEQILIEAHEKKLGIGIDTANGKITGVRDPRQAPGAQDSTNAVIGKFPTHYGPGSDAQ